MHTQERFFERTENLELIRKRVLGLKDSYRQNICLIGNELAGKTSLLHAFLGSFQDNLIVPVYLEARPESPLSFARRFIGVLLYNFMSNSGIPLKEDLEFLIGRSSRFIPQTVARMQTLLKAAQRRSIQTLFAELLALTDIFYRETGKSCVVIFDEFLNLESIGFKNLYRDWSRQLILQKNTMYVITSSLPFKAREALSKNLSLLFGNFEVVEVEPFDIRTSDRYLEQQFTVLPLLKPLRDFIVHFTGGTPWYLEEICQELRKSGRQNLTSVLEGLIFEPTGLLHQRFSNIINRFLDSPHSHDYLSILHLISGGRNKLKDIAHLLRKSQKDLLPRVKYLLEVDAITRSGDFLKINDRVFAFWLRLVYQERLRSLTFDAKNQKEQFRENIEREIREFVTASRKTLPERCSEVLRLFEDELIQVERKKIRLNHFREIKPLEFNDRRLREGLIGRSQDSLWILAFKPETLNEEDIVRFAKECKKYRHKQQRKIIVTLEDEIDPNTRLRAMEEKIWTWDINRLNQMLDLFSKPWIIA
jgi:hypothetical protein